MFKILEHLPSVGIAKFLIFHFSSVLILDWDVHHGNGTQHEFYEDPRLVTLHFFFFQNFARCYEIHKVLALMGF